MIIQSNHIVTHDAKYAFDNDKPYINDYKVGGIVKFKGATTIEVLKDVTIYSFFGHILAFRYHDKPNEIQVAIDNLNDRSSRYRLDSIEGISLIKRNGKYYLNGEVWNGRTITIKTR